MKITNTKELGLYIKKIRRANSLTQADVAMSANVGVRFIVDLEKGKETAQIGKIISVCNVLGIELNLSTLDVTSLDI